MATYLYQVAHLQLHGEDMKNYNKNLTSLDFNQSQISSEFMLQTYVSSTI